MVDSTGRGVIDVRTSAGVSAAQAFEAWEGAVSAAYVPMSVSPVQLGDFHGRVDAAQLGDLTLSRVRASAQLARRTRRLVALSDEPMLFAVIQCGGAPGWLEQGERVCGPQPGEMYLLDTGRPYTVCVDDCWDRIVAQVPLAPILERTGLRPDEIRTGVPLPGTGAVGVVGRFFRDLIDLRSEDSAGLELLAAHGMDLLAAAVRLAASEPRCGRYAEVLDLTHYRSRCAGATPE
ncbi:hypothetical protein [Nocardia sp. CC227C]|uniref:cupin domain-containing protein n=1 Tax=Nocardia sp. CC227C TaxID=3044562 RepID=UPI00278C84F2|nr:hypothetical protein [Nocardia sp. CC227C]